MVRGEAETKSKSVAALTVKATPVDHWPPLQLRLAQCLFELQDYAEASRCCQQAMAIEGGVNCLVS
jgi:hypothetical protein